MKKIILFASICSSVLTGHSQSVLNPDQLVLMEYSFEHAHIDSQAVQAFTLDANQIITVDSLIFSTVNFYNIQVTRGSLTVEEKVELDSLSDLQGDFQQVHKRKGKYRKRKLAQFAPLRQSQIKTFGENRDSLHQVMLSLYTKSMRDRQQKIVQYAGMGSNTIDLPSYLRQYMPYVNQEGERMVYVICLRDSRKPLTEDPEYRAEMKKSFMWCGDCYEGLIYARINLERKKVIYFRTN